MSALAWIDFDEAERQRAQRIMALFEESETRDELGLGAIRDAISDHLFPGTNTIQTRLRYMLFIPWLFRTLESRNLPEAQLRNEARALEVRLIDALKAGGESLGVIGHESGDRLQRMPSSIYWAGLGAWGIRTHPGSIDSLFIALSRRGPSRPYPHPALDGGDGTEGLVAPGTWSDVLPKEPDKLLERAVFRMTTNEADFIVDRLNTKHRKALLTWLASAGPQEECDYIWKHPRLGDFPKSAKRLVLHAEIFSQVMNGATLLYNLAISELREHNDWIENYRERIADWSAALSATPENSWSEELERTWGGRGYLAEIRNWPLDEFWDAVRHKAHGINPAAKRFVMEWRELLLEAESQATLEAVVVSEKARSLVEMRERRLKGSQSRYVNQAVRDRWSGASGVGRLGFRWETARSHLRDLAEAWNPAKAGDSSDAE